MCKAGGLLLSQVGVWRILVGRFASHLCCLLNQTELLRGAENNLQHVADTFLASHSLCYCIIPIRLIDLTLSVSKSRPALYSSDLD